MFKLDYAVDLVDNEVIKFNTIQHAIPSVGSVRDLILWQM